MLHSKRFECKDKAQNVYLIGECGRSDLPKLIEMYDNFSPKQLTQGLPPSRDELRRAWVGKLVDSGPNFAVWFNDEIIGHAAILPDMDRKDAEFIVFVLGSYQNRGLGSQLTEMSVNKANELGVADLWLTVEAFNYRAIRVYRKVGFDFFGEEDLERVMVLRL